MWLAIVRRGRDAKAGRGSVVGLARELVLLMLLSHRFDRACAFAKLPRDVVALIGKRVLSDARDVRQRACWATLSH